MLNLRIIKWMGLTPMVKPTITVDLLKESVEIKPIDYSQIKHMKVIKVGKHTSDFNSSPLAQIVMVTN